MEPYFTFLSKPSGNAVFIEHFRPDSDDQVSY